MSRIKGKIYRIEHEGVWYSPTTLFMLTARGITTATVSGAIGSMVFYPLDWFIAQGYFSSASKMMAHAVASGATQFGFFQDPSVVARGTETLANALIGYTVAEVITQGRVATGVHKIVTNVFLQKRAAKIVQKARQQLQEPGSGQ